MAVLGRDANNSRSLKERQLSKAVKQATKFLEKQGLTVS